MRSFFSIFSPKNAASEAPTIDRKAEKRKKYVYFGGNNLFPQNMVDLADNSALHGAALDKMGLFIAGEGVYCEAESDKMAADALKWLEEATGDLQQFHGKTCKDLALLDGFAWQIHPLRGGDGVKAYHRDVTTVRVTKMAPTDIDVVSYHVSNNWKEATKVTGKYKPDQKWFEPDIIPVFDPLKPIVEPQLLYHRGYKPGKVFYPEPTYMGALRWIEIDAELSAFILGDIQNGFSGNMHIHIFDAEADKPEIMSTIKGDIKKEFTTSSGERVVITASLPGTDKPDISGIPRQSNEKVMTFIAEAVDNKILIGDQMPPRLINKSVATGLSSESSDQKESMQIFQNTVIQPRQNVVTNRYEELIRLGGFDDVQVKIKDLTPISFNASDQVRLLTEKVNEIRKSNSLEEIDDGDYIPLDTRDGDE